METVDPTTAIEAADAASEQRRERGVAALEWFLDTDGLVPRGDAVAALSDAHGWSNGEANQAVASVVGDLVDPVQQVPHPEKGKLVGTIKYHEAPDNGCYGYVDYDDAVGKRRRAVCSRCVEIADSDTEVAHATEGEGTVPPGAAWVDLYTTIESHYADDHDVEPSSVEVGAALANGTTISGNKSFHAGNDGPGSGLDADSLEGNEPDDLGTTTADIQESSLIHSSGFAPGFSG